ncbi:hypothetical protein EDB81DRAFT_876899 [Dactylonectria macrodidyma]|uniref:Uncharacterized protein n=1 Tax=Dactylonectria macrodidyma TaxID=307937 RepID=A0A9P9JPN0_9HYPO|nr:hypothetical protein EDB81DRAFT_876899 [Dactylonectria macrodidyma]
MADSMSYLYTIGGYAALLGLGYVVYVSTQKNKKRAGAPLAKAAKALPTEPRKEEKKKKKQRMDTFASEAQESSKKAPKPEAGGDAPEQSAWLSNTQDKADDVDNIKFAKQLAKAQSGTKFASKSEGGKQREKSVKQSRANKINVAVEEKESAPSSTTGADADDDQSPITSPEVGPAVAGDVSDMLEATASRPAVLRLTDTAPKQQKPKAAKAPEPVETKKQRQNRKKAEAAKLAREESEKDRKVLEEKQRRTARIAEGRAAKDGSQFMAANGSKSSWTQGAPSNKATPTSGTNGIHQPLDTFEPATTTAKPATTAKPTQGNWISSLPSEEEQMEMLKTDEDEWSTVKTKTKSKKNPKTDSSVDSGDEPLQSRPSAQPKQGAQTGKSASTFGSFSALSTKDEPAEEEIEEEWEV